MTTDEVQEIAEYVGTNAWQESVFLTPDPIWNIDAHAFLDWLHEKTGVGKEQIGVWANGAYDRAQANS